MGSGKGRARRAASRIPAPGERARKRAPATHPPVGLMIDQSGSMGGIDFPYVQGSSHISDETSHMIEEALRPREEKVSVQLTDGETGDEPSTVAGEDFGFVFTYNPDAKSRSQAELGELHQKVLACGPGTDFRDVSLHGADLEMAYVRGAELSEEQIREWQMTSRSQAVDADRRAEARLGKDTRS